MSDISQVALLDKIDSETVPDHISIRHHWRIQGRPVPNRTQYFCFRQKTNESEVDAPPTGNPGSTPGHGLLTNKDKLKA